jgi:hypothetical protein
VASSGQQNYRGGADVASLSKPNKFNQKIDEQMNNMRPNFRFNNSSMMNIHPMPPTVLQKSHSQPINLKIKRNL